MIYSPHQQTWLAHWLTLEGKAEDSMMKTIASAKVDMNPHQVEAAMFALASPLSSGVILADEVGLGKTIEASLVLAQKWAERRRKLLLIVPATLRKQWSLELEEKFSLPSVIIESKSFKETLQNGFSNPFDLEVTSGNPAICICSYEFAARKAVELTRVPWDLVVLDEAHKLRNIYKKDGAKTARTLGEALAGRKKVLLSATPLQNSILELYGLVSVIDPHFFGDLDSFKARYAKQKLDAVELTLLQNRLSKICNRTLRRQVQEAGGISFTRRFSMTEDFCPNQDEELLYKQVSAYLQRDDLLAIKPGARHLVTLVIRKILASSSFAVQGTLETMIKRLEQRQSFTEALQDFDNLDDYQDEEGISDDEFADSKALQDEIAQLKAFMKLAASIGSNAKASALLRVLERAFEKTSELGGARKSVIFTESVRTQSWLAQVLSEHGFKDEIVILNGSNNDALSREIYRDWLEKHKGSSRISGSKTADMKAALVEKFRDDATIMICTEAGAEGINLQFCSLLVNYDLPWNPQRVEQRIGRVHRYGQKNDVVVVNFINKGNKADERVFELLSQKFQLFEGVFGASDEVLGSIESGIDIERRIHDIYQKCRSDEEIESEFNVLQDQLREQLEQKDKETRRSLLEHFDEDVVDKLNTRREKIGSQLSSFQQRLLLMARMSLAPLEEGYEESPDGFTWRDNSYSVDWEYADKEDLQFFRATSGLGQQLIESAKKQALAGAHLCFRYQTESAQWVDVKNLIGQCGTLKVSKACIGTSESQIERLLLAAVTDAGESVHPETIERLLQLPLQGWPEQNRSTVKHVNEVDLALKSQLERFVVSAEQDNESYYNDEAEKLERWAEDRRVALDLQIKQQDREIKDARKAIRSMATLQEKIAAKKHLKKLERDRDTAILNYHEEKKRIEQEEDRLLEEVEARLDSEHQLMPLFSLTWELG